MLHAKEYLCGNPLDPQNPFHYDVIILNLVAQPDYKPSCSCTMAYTFMLSMWPAIACSAKGWMVFPEARLILVF